MWCKLHCMHFHGWADDVLIWPMPGVLGFVKRANPQKTWLWWTCFTVKPFRETYANIIVSLEVLSGWICSSSYTSVPDSISDEYFYALSECWNWKQPRVCTDAWTQQRFQHSFCCMEAPLSARYVPTVDPHCELAWHLLSREAVYFGSALDRYWSINDVKQCNLRGKNAL